MIATSRRWFRRNRTNLAIGAGVIGAGYLAGQYVVGKIQEARQRMSEDRIAKENLRRRFEQNQEDCTYTVLALLPSIRDEIIDALPVEQVTEQLQHERQERLRRLGASEAASTDYPSVPPSVADEDGKSLSSSSYVHASQMATSLVEGGAPSSRSKKSKAQLWQEMKVNSITRALTLIYTISLLALLTRIQLNLLGRRTYLSSVVALASPAAAQQSSTISLENRDDDNYDNVYGNDFETNRKYLTFSWWLLHRGSKQIMERVMAAVRDVFGQVNIREDMSLERLAELIMDVRKHIEGTTEEDRQRMKWLTYLLPPQAEEAFVVRQATMSGSEGSPSPDAVHTDDPLSGSADEEAINGSLRRLLDETADLIDSPTFSQVLTRLLDAAYSNLVDYRIATEAFKATGLSAPAVSVQGMSAYEESRITEVTDNTCKLAHILPVFCRQAHLMVAGSGELDPDMTGVLAQEALGNEYLSAIDQVPELGAFAAVIYSSNFEYEVVEGTGAGTPFSDAVQSLPVAPEPIAAVIPGPAAQVNETELPIVVDSALSESATGEGAGAVQENAPSSVEQFSGGALESAWKNALAVEDGKKAPDGT
ncbi:hypothetical protein LTR36_009326 [Oleoguttula mirabilis]|uniref:Peroxisomal biogenesis factor 3 n=1 Tax=Oleoguttula mirabilis TaxID=1507867 RepID=A0AAV9JTS4_9PEZI|nr:hypothetical protein LTR36_009326 [Oleoguttula mirabilis]